jgi:hypothetical protein
MIALCIGRKEQGKTTLAYHLVSSMSQRVVFDPRDRFKTTDLIEDSNVIYDALSEGQPEVIIYAAESTAYHFNNTSLEVADFAKQYPEKRFGFLVDEVGLALDDGIPEKFGWLLKATKKDQARVVMTTWRPTEVPPLIRSQIDHCFIFKTTERRDLEFIEEQCGDDAATKVQTLAPYTFVHCDDSGPERRIEVFSDSKVWNVDIEKFREQNKCKPLLVTAIAR